MSQPDMDKRVQRYLDGLCDAAEVAELEAWIQREPAAAQRLAEAARMEACLERHFREHQSMEQAQSMLRERLAATTPRVQRAWWGQPRVWLAAAMVALATAAVWLVASHWEHPTEPGRPTSGQGQGVPPSPPMVLTTGAEVLSGQVLVQGRPTATLVPDQAFTVTGGEARVRLADASVATLDNGSRAVLHARGERGDRQTLQFHEGGGRFVVTSAPGRFVVATRSHRVTALGTEFTVRIVPIPSGGGKEREERARQQVHITVVHGVVEVRRGDRGFTLNAGDTRQIDE